MKRILVYTFATIIPILVVVYFYSNHNLLTVKCIFHSVTGLWCPGCGGQRAFTLLVHGHVLDSLRYNLLLPAALYVAIVFYYSAVGNIFLKVPISSKLGVSPRFLKNFLLFLLIYAILRNIPLVPFVYLAPPIN